MKSCRLMQLSFIKGSEAIKKRKACIQMILIEIKA